MPPTKRRPFNAGSDIRPVSGSRPVSSVVTKTRTMRPTAMPHLALAGNRSRVSQSATPAAVTAPSSHNRSSPDRVGAGIIRPRFDRKIMLDTL